MKFSPLALCTVLLAAGVQGFAGVGPKSLARTMATRSVSLPIELRISIENSLCLELILIRPHLVLNLHEHCC